MITYTFLAIVAASTVLAINNWRLGIYLWLLLAILQDPVRKITPGTPVYLTVSFAPVYAATFLGAMQEFPYIRLISESYPRLVTAFKALLLCVAISFAFGMLNPEISLMRGAIGLLSYLGGVPAVIVGMAYVRKEKSDGLVSLVFAFVVVTAILLIGTQLEHMGVKFSKPILGTINSETVQRRWFNNLDYVTMVAGFYRSGEIMGWHSIMMVLGCVFLSLKIPRINIAWGSLAAWGVYCSLLSGRRKMMVAMIVFLVLLFLFSSFQDRKRMVGYLIPIGILVVPAVVYLVDDLYLMTFTSGLENASSKLAEKGMSGPLWLMGIVGPFGYGVGAIAQGAQHFGTMNSYIPLVEGGFEKVMVELGLVGTFVGMALVVSIVRTAIGIVRPTVFKQGSNLDSTFCFALVFANAAAFLIAFQFLGDPFIASFVGFMYGGLLAFGLPENNPSLTMQGISTYGRPAWQSGIAPQPGYHLPYGSHRYSRGR